MGFYYLTFLCPVRGQFVTAFPPLYWFSPRRCFGEFSPVVFCVREFREREIFFVLRRLSVGISSVMRDNIPLALSSFARD